MGKVENVKNNSAGVEDPKLAAIKEIIFGDNIKEYDQEFKAIHAMIDKQDQELRNKMDKIKEGLEKMIQELNSSMSDKLDSLKDEAFDKINQLAVEKGEEKKALGDMLIEVGNRLKSST